MSDDQTRVIRKEDAGIGLEITDPHGESDFHRMDFSEVRILPSGWVECRKPDDEEDRKNFFPPQRVFNIFVYDEDETEQVGTW